MSQEASLAAKKEQQSTHKHRPHLTTQQCRWNAQKVSPPPRHRWTNQPRSCHVLSILSLEASPASLFLPDKALFSYHKVVNLFFLEHVRIFYQSTCSRTPEIATRSLSGFRRWFPLFRSACLVVPATMDDVKDKMKGFMKKVNSPFTSSSSGKFKGQGRVLGSSTSGPTNPNNPRPPTQSSSAAAAAAAAASRLPNAKSPQPPRPALTDEKNPSFGGNPEWNREPGTGFDPFDSLVTSSKRSQNGYTLNVVECPICNRAFKTEDEVSEHVDSCVGDGNGSLAEADRPDSWTEENCDLEACVGAFLSGKPSESSLDVVLKLFRNIVREPENPKFRKIRMSNPKIREAIGDVAGGLELLEAVGFELNEEDGEMLAVMEVAGKDRVDLIANAITLLEPKKSENPAITDNLAPSDSSGKDKPTKPKSIDRQIRVFFSVPESVAARIELPDSFYSLSIDEAKREADMRKKKIADSQLLIPKSYREKQMKAGRKRYNRTMIRVQFPDGVVLQGVFAPWEPTTALYEFVATALKEPCLEFELMHPVVVKRRVIPHWASPGEKAVTLDDEDLVPSALVKFRPIETDSVLFTGLKNELLETIEPLL